jgi:shikimate kinase
MDNYEPKHEARGSGREDTSALSARHPVPKTILLVGFMGCGKSSVARLLARNLGCNTCDIDTLIETAAGKSIPQIFAEEGEEAFRQQETTQLKIVLENKGAPAVVASGGGIVTRPENRELLQNAAQNGVLVVYLKASPAVLAKRIRLQPGKRPLIDGNGELNLQQTQERVGELLQVRSPLYESVAGLVVDTDTLSLEEVVQQIVTAAVRVTATN